MWKTHTKKEKNNFNIKIPSTRDNHCQHLVYYAEYTFEHVYTQVCTQTHNHMCASLKIIKLMITCLIHLFDYCLLIQQYIVNVPHFVSLMKIAF